MTITVTLDESEARLILYLLERKAEQSHYSYSTGRRRYSPLDQLLGSSIEKFEALIPNKE